jgi:hypothetical protein
MLRYKTKQSYLKIAGVIADLHIHATVQNFFLVILIIKYLKMGNELTFLTIAKSISFDFLLLFSRANLAL